MPSRREHGAGDGGGPPEPRPSFLSYDPVELRFGTSGLRGLVRDITDLEAVVNTRGFLLFLRETKRLKGGETVVLAGDLRESTPRILRAAARAIRDEGFLPEYLGLIPTPALAYYALRRGQASIMVTGSHIPADRNGIKFNRPAGEVLKEDEPGILSAVTRIRRRVYRDPDSGRCFDERGCLRQSPALPPLLTAGEAEYRRRYVEAFGPSALAGRRIVVYQHTAVGRDQLVDILGDLGAEPVPVGRSEIFEPLDTENVTTERAAFFRDLVKEHPSAAAVVSTDGDGDRPLLVDETGSVKRGDALGALVAGVLQARLAAVPVSVNDLVDRHLESLGIVLRKTCIGSPYVVEAMKQAVEEDPEGVVGWEANGGFLTASDLELEGGTLEALPTRDAVLPLVAALTAALRQQRSLSGLFSGLPSRFAESGLLDEVPIEESRAMLNRFVPGALEGAREVAFRGERVLLVAEPGLAPAMVRSLAREEELRSYRRELERYFPRGEGFGRVRHLNLVDGLRITFEGGDIAHLRPSGNAPQLRIYAVSDSAERAGEIVRSALAEPEGILRRMLRSSLGQTGACGPEEE